MNKQTGYIVAIRIGRQSELFFIPRKRDAEALAKRFAAQGAETAVSVHRQSL